MSTPSLCELHMHSTFSDGYVTPEGLMQCAHDKGLRVVAITDHDNARGARAAVPAAAALGLDLIPAIEFTGRWDACTRPGWSKDVDVLGYFIDLDHLVFRAYEQAVLMDIQARIAACCVHLTRAGYPVHYDEVLAQNPRYAGARQLREVMVNKGYAPGFWETLDLFSAHWQNVRLSAFTIQEHISMIRQAGGVVIMAHPHDIDCGAGLIGADEVAQLIEMGVDGLEVYHRNTTGAAREHFQALADQFGLLASGGSDEHGWSPDCPLMGQQPVTLDMVEAIRARHAARKSEAVS